jgi:hypothetical protein
MRLSVELCAFSFIWYLLDTTLIPPSKRLFALPQGLQGYIDLMNEFKTLYDGTDGKLQCIDKIVQYIQIKEGPELAFLDSGMMETSPSAALLACWDSPDVDPFQSAWASILSETPYKYLRIVLTVEHSLSKGQLPTDGDFPRTLRVE